jgi:hypothetical protein
MLNGSRGHKCLPKGEDAFDVLVLEGFGKDEVNLSYLPYMGYPDRLFDTGCTQSGGQVCYAVYRHATKGWEIRNHHPNSGVTDDVYYTGTEDPDDPTNPMKVTWTAAAPEYEPVGTFRLEQYGGLDVQLAWDHEIELSGLKFGDNGGDGIPVPKSLQFQGSNDGLNWTDIVTIERGDLFSDGNMMEVFIVDNSTPDPDPDPPAQCIGPCIVKEIAIYNGGVDWDDSKFQKKLMRWIGDDCGAVGLPLLTADGNGMLFANGNRWAVRGD